MEDSAASCMYVHVTPQCHSHFVFACHAVLATHFFLSSPPSSPSPFSFPSLLPFFLSPPFLHCHFLSFLPLLLSFPPLSLFLLSRFPFTDIYLHDGGGMFSIVHCHLDPARSCMHLLAHLLQSKTYSKNHTEEDKHLVSLHQ